ncbi:hypothetical protein TBLA_0F00430 [Henningerozyma blattae CBS 6284]|uniref:Protein YIP n=1 Tax=Henningerozyma blattae (strain ATCC 34711 / CBS 6284 / DSM 70876 / NBRC 10599 / NRRL Y-10934 / UCD 77-7) TaxID=1071380 RepID=I2H5D5_HENB6|nr:hypothetical protein TBLA_0F00430 [Tetrapisispora blattae CBS 6284]CCH61587.1 hypothetical protein TBLA_0F00430 [Tetrapisispora blattae CBS 6284]
MASNIPDTDAFIEPDIIDPEPVNSRGGMPMDIPSGNMDSIGGMDNSNLGMNNPTNLSAPLRGTLDETILQTLKRDLLNINFRLRQVVYPHFPTGRSLTQGSSQQTNNVQDIAAHCDLWAPLLFIISYSLAVSHAHSLFSSLFVSCWSVLIIMALHLRLTKPYDSVSLVSYISVVGYCIFPQVIQSCLTQVILPLCFKPIKNPTISVRVLMILKLVLTGIATLWSVTAATLVSNSRSFIHVYPLGLCLFGLSWLATIL